MKNIITVAKFEYFRTVKKLSFWLTTISIPVLMIVLVIISGLNSIQTEERFEQLSKDTKEILILDEANVINKDYVKEPMKLVDNFDQALDRVKKSEVDALIHYPEDIYEGDNYKIYAQDKGLLGQVGYSSAADNLLNLSVISKVEDQSISKLLLTKPGQETVIYDKEGKVVDDLAKRIAIPVISGAIFVLAVFISASYLLQSVSEEKENRMIELILSIVKDDILIYGKILGLSLVVLTQLILWLVMSLGIFAFAMKAFSFNIPLVISGVDLITIGFNLFFVLAGFLLFAAIMVGVGAVGTSYKDSQNLSGTFIMISTIPLYFITAIITDPNGPLSMVLSYFPLTSAMIFLIRNSLNVLPVPELILGFVLNIIYVIIAFIIATKLFKLGSLMYNRKPTMNEIFRVLSNK